MEDLGLRLNGYLGRVRLLLGELVLDRRFELLRLRFAFGGFLGGLLSGFFYFRVGIARP